MPEEKSLNLTQQLQLQQRLEAAARYLLECFAADMPNNTYLSINVWPDAILAKIDHSWPDKRGVVAEVFKQLS